MNRMAGFPGGCGYRHVRQQTAAAFAAFLALACSANDVKWTNYTQNTPDTAYDWNTKANWQDQIVGASGDYVNVWVSSQPVYIRLDSTVEPRYIGVSSSYHPFFLGDITFRDDPSAATDDTKRIKIYGGYYYGDVTVPSGLVIEPYLTSGVNFCGKLFHLAGSSKRLLMPSGSQNFCFNRFARAAGEQRYEDVVGQNGWWAAGNGTLTIYGPEGSAAATGRWRLTEGSPYAYRVSSAAHGLAVGTAVTADGEGVLDSGTFLKHVFNDATIELSSPALTSGEADLSFAAFTPDFTAEFVNQFRVQGASVKMKLVKKRAEDKVRVVFNEFYCSYNLAQPVIGLVEGEAGIPGTFVIKTLTGNWKDNVVELANCVIELAGNGSSSVDFDSNHPVSLPTASLTSCLSVPEGKSSSIAS